MAGETELNADTVMINDGLRGWVAARYGYYFLPDAAKQDFIQYHTDQIDRGQAKKYTNWVKAFQNFIIWTSPSGRWANAARWEKWIDRAKQLDKMQRARVTPFYHPDPVRNKPFDGQQIQKDGPRLAIEHMKNKLRGLIE